MVMVAQLTRVTASRGYISQSWTCWSLDFLHPACRKLYQISSPNCIRFLQLLNQQHEPIVSHWIVTITVIVRNRFFQCFNAVGLVAERVSSPLKIEWCGAGVVICQEQSAIVCTWSSWCHYHPIVSCSFKSRMVQPLWYRLTRVVLVKRLLNGVSLLSEINGMPSVDCCMSFCV